jgi:1-acyl-sn-glycerol-3-phosphate acyltransferase
LISGTVIKNYKKYIGKAEILKWPVLGYLLDKLYIPVHRDDKDHRAWSMDQLYVKAKEGASIVLFPEGTCNNTKEHLKKFHDGAFKLAIPTKLPIAVFTIIGAGELWPRDTILIKPGKIIVYWSEIIKMDEYTSVENDMEKLKEKVRETMKPYLEKHYPNGY